MSRSDMRFGSHFAPASGLSDTRHALDEIGKALSSGRIDWTLAVKFRDVVADGGASDILYVLCGEVVEAA